MALKGFDQSYYLNALLNYFEEKYTDWSANPKTVADVEAWLSDNDLTAEEHYMTLGWADGLAPNAYFDADQYSAAYARAAGDTAEAITGNPYEHYLANSMAMNLNPSNTFDESQFMEDYLAAEGSDMTVDALRQALVDAADPESANYDENFVGLTALTAYMINPDAFDALGVSPVAVSGDEWIPVPGENSALTSGADNAVGTNDDDVFVATEDTLSSADNIDGLLGNDELKVSSNSERSFAAFEMDNVEELTVTADQGEPLTFDLSGTSGLDILRTLNSTGDVNFEEITELANIEANNMTEDADLTVQFQDSVLEGDDDTVDVLFENSLNADINVITIGDETTGNEGVETINIETKGAGTMVNALDSAMETLNISGDQDLTIETALNGNVSIVNASGLDADIGYWAEEENPADPDGDLINMPYAGLNLGLTDGVTYTGAMGVDIITLIDDVSGERSDGENNISTGTGDDLVYLALGAATVDLGEGDDALELLTGGLTVADEITGGAGTDTITLMGADSIELSEAEQVTHIENFNLTTTGTLLVVSDNMVTTVDNDPAMFTVDMGVSGNTVDIQNVTFSNTAKITINGTEDSGNEGAADLVVANDATVNAKAIINYGDDDGDILRVVDHATITADDMANITGLNRIELVSDSSEAQTWNLALNQSAFDYDADDPQPIEIYVDQDVQTGSVLNLDLSGISDTREVRLLGNANITIGNLIDPNGVLTEMTSLEFTENADTNLIGTDGDDIFVANSLDQMDPADNADGGDGTDTLRVDFAVNNDTQLLGALFNNASLNNFEIIEFNTDLDVVFRDLIGVGGATTVNFGDGDDAVTAGTRTATYNFGEGDDSYTAGANADPLTWRIARETLNGGEGDDTFTFNDINLYNVETYVNPAFTASADVINGDAGMDTLNITNDDVDGSVRDVHDADGLTAPTLSGIDVINLTIDNHADNGFRVSDDAVEQADDNTTVTFGLVDANNTANTQAIFDASDVRAGNSVNVTLNAVDTDNPNDATDTWGGYAAGAAASTAANYVNVDIIGGAGDDTISLGNSNAEGYAIAGNAGADTIDISGADDTDGAWIVFQSPNDGGDAGANTGFDTITGFESGRDAVAFLRTNFGATNEANTAAGANLVIQSDAPVDFSAGGGDNALLMTQTGTGMTDADLLDLSLVAANANVHGVTAGAADGGFIVVQGQNDTALYMYVEQDGTENRVATDELKMLAVFEDEHLGVNDFQYVVNQGGGIVNPNTINIDAADATTLQGTVGTVETFVYQIDSSSTGNVLSREGADLTLTDFTVGEDMLQFQDVATGITTTATFTGDVIISASGIQNLTDIVFDQDPATGNGYTLTLAGIADAALATVDFEVV